MSKTKIHMDTKHDREGLHIYYTNTELAEVQDGSAVVPGSSIHITRQEAKALIEEIRRRLF